MTVVLSEPCGTCQPCNGHCDQGRACPAAPPRPAEACTDVGADDERDDGMGTVRGLMWGLPISAALVAAAVGVAWFLPYIGDALKALART